MPDSARMNELPLVSIVMPNFNGGGFIAQAVDSVLAQTYTNWELLIVDDASTDDSCAVIHNLSAIDSRIKPFFARDNGGVASARNMALEAAAGRYVAFLDSDDFWPAQKLSRQIGFMLQTDCAISYTEYLRVSEDGMPLNRVVSPDMVDYANMLRTDHIGTLTAVYDMKLLGKHFYRNNGRADYLGKEDYIVWLEILSNGTKAYKIASEEPLAFYRVSHRSLTANKLKAAQRQWNVYRHQLGLPIWRCLACMATYAYFALKKRTSLSANPPQDRFYPVAKQKS